MLLAAVLIVSVVDAAWDDDAPEYASEALAKAETRERSTSDPQTDFSLRPTVYADILVYDTKKTDCAGTSSSSSGCGQQ